MRKSQALRLTEYSATVSQVMFRYRVISTWFVLFSRLRSSSNDTERRRIKMSLFTSIGIVVVDVLAGIMCALLLSYRPEVFFSPIQKAYLYLNNEVLQSVVAWLMDSPAGLQMNRNLVVFLGTISLTVVTYWDALVLFCLTSPGYVDVDWVVSTFLAIVSGVFGVSLLLSVLIDLGSFVFFHIFFLCLGTTRLWHATMQVIGSFMHFFNGKKYNVLKHRVDNHEFNVDQLILGTVFLSMVVFLLPTVLVFYITYVLLWSGVVLLQLLMRATVSVFSFFPLTVFIIKQNIPYKRAILYSPSEDTNDGQASDNSATTLSLEVKILSLSVSDIMREFFKSAITLFPISGHLISKTLGGLVKGTALIFPRYAEHDGPSISDSTIHFLDYGPNYGRLFRRLQ